MAAAKSVKRSSTPNAEGRGESRASATQSQAVQAPRNLLAGASITVHFQCGARTDRPATSSKKESVQG